MNGKTKVRISILHFKENVKLFVNDSLTYFIKFVKIKIQKNKIPQKYLTFPE